LSAWLRKSFTTPARRAHDVVVPFSIGVAAGGSTKHLGSRDECLFLKGRQGAVDGVSRAGRHPLAHPPVDGFGVRVLVGGGQFAEGLHSLMGGAEPLSADRVGKHTHASPEF